MRARKKHDDLLADSFARAKEEQARLDALRDGALVGAPRLSKEDLGMRDLMTNLKRRGVLV